MDVVDLGRAEHGMKTGSSARFWSGCGVGFLVCLPCAWLLSYGALLPFYLGLFFFVVFGLMIGAAVFRVASKGQPYGRWTVLAGTTVLVGACWSLSLVKESRDFPTDVAAETARRARDLGGRTPDAFRADVAQGVRAYLIGKYPPGGTLGYLRWALTNGDLRKGDVPDVDQAPPRTQGRIGFAIRVVLSIGLLAFGVGSQTLTLGASPQRGAATLPGP